MPASIRKIGLLILLMVILPVLIFSIFEIGNLRQNEKVIQDIYRNQLDAILYSINQYSDDIISTLASRIENTMEEKTDIANKELNKLINEVPSVINLIMLDTNYSYISSINELTDKKLSFQDVKLTLNQNDSVLLRLHQYMYAGYRKIEAISNSEDNYQWIVFYIHTQDKDVINVLIIDPEIFINQVLDPKIQEIAKNKFHIVAYRAGEKDPFYTSDKNYNTSRVNDKKSFWLLKNYQMGIELRDLTIADLAKESMRKNLLLIGFMDIILLISAWIIFRNIKKQMELSQLKSDFVSSVSHEIRTPLALISMYIETLEMGRVRNSEKIKEYYTIILNETTRLSGIVNRILNFSQIDNNKRKYALSETNVNEIVENASLTFRYLLENKGFTFSFIKEDDLPLIAADKEAVADAFVNLIDNAMKYSTDRKNIIVRTGKNNTHVFLEVEDQGIGISGKNQKYIFDKFYRVTEKNLANRVKGSGLGLSIVRHIMDAHGGEIFVKSMEGEGSLFRLSFPLKQFK